MKKILLTLGTVVVISAPVASVIACGSSKRHSELSKTTSEFGELVNKAGKDKLNNFKGWFTTLTQETEFLESNDIIKDDQFKDEKRLTEISLPNAKKIGKNSFINSPLTSLSIPKAEKIWPNAFSSSNLKSLSLPKVQAVGENAFEHSNFIFLSIPNVSAIGNHAFKIINSSETKITLPIKFDSASEKLRIFNGPVDKVSFRWVQSNSKIGSDWIKVSSIDSKSDNKYSGDFSELNKKIEFLNVNSEVNDNEFKDEGKLTSLTMPNVTYIGENAFKSAKLTSLNIPQINSIDEKAFYSSCLTTLSLPKVTFIGAMSFNNSWITSLELPKVKFIGNSAFGDSELTSLELPEATFVGEDAFYFSHLDHLSIPNIKQIQAKAFFDSDLASLYIPNVEKIGSDVFHLKNSPDTKVTMPSKFNTHQEKMRIFNGPVDQVNFSWV